MARCPFARWEPIPENGTQSKITPTQIILHTAVDPAGETDLHGYFARGDVTVESHFFIQNDGDIFQYMDTTVRADANRDANARAISIETEDDGAPAQTPWTEAQVASIKRLIAWLHDTHGIPITQCPVWDQPGIGWHAMWGSPSHWTPYKGKTCPGPVRIDQAKQIISEMAAAPAPAPTPAPVAAAPTPSNGVCDVDMPVLKQGDTRKGAVTSLQMILNGRFGQRLVADGDFGPKTKQAVINVQRYCRIGDDGIVGPKTWAVCFAG